MWALASNPRNWVPRARASAKASASDEPRRGLEWKGQRNKTNKTKLQTDPRSNGLLTWHSEDWGREMASLRIHSKT